MISRSRPPALSRSWLQGALIAHSGVTKANDRRLGAPHASLACARYGEQSSALVALLLRSRRYAGQAGAQATRA
jgi:hypothetical protein